MTFDLASLRGARVTVVEVGPRDGLQNEKTLLPTEVKAVPTPADMARTRKSDGHWSNDSCMEQPQFERLASLSPASAGCVATMWTLSVH